MNYHDNIYKCIIGKRGFRDYSEFNDGDSEGLEDEAAESRDGTRILWIKMVIYCLTKGWGEERLEQ